MELVLVRHGDTEWSRTGQHTGSTDLDLLEHGQAQARGIAPVLAKIVGDRPAVVYSSPMKRAVVTAALAFPQGQARACDLLREYDYGDYEGLTTKEILARVPGWDIWRDGCPNGEQPADVGARADRFLADCAAHDGPVVAVSHGHMSRILAARALGIAASEGRLFTLDTASVSVIKDVRGKRAVALWNLVGDLIG
jgi:broad specificity phosphatase PhoE